MFEETDQPGVSELRELVAEVFGDRPASGSLLHLEALHRSRVFRLSFETDGTVRCLIAKRFERARAKREQLVLRKWLPAVGLAHIGPKLLGVAAQSQGLCVWHLYEDLGVSPPSREGRTPCGGAPIEESRGNGGGGASYSIREVGATVELLANLHSHFVAHPLLSECRVHGGDLGASSLRTNVKEAIRSLEALKTLKGKPSARLSTLSDRLLARLSKVQGELADRVAILTEFGGPETFLHGDMSMENTVLLKTDRQVEARLIDWDHVGVGQASYDLSNLLVQFPSQDRDRVLNHYQEAREEPYWKGLSKSDWNLLFETAELSRLAVSVVWPAIAARESEADTAVQMLAEIERWFDQLEPVLIDS